MNQWKYLIALLFGFSHLTFATTLTEGKAISLMSLQFGAFVYTNDASSDSDSWLWAEEPYDMSGPQLKQSAFQILYTDEGYARFRNTISNRCAGLYYNSGISQQSCTSANTLIDILPIEGGSYALKFVNTDQCWTIDTNSNAYEITPGPCPKSFAAVEYKQQWMFSPAIFTKSRRLD